MPRMIKTASRIDVPHLQQRETGTVARVLMILRAVAQSRTEPTTKGLADQLNLPLSTMHRLLDLLTREDLLARDPATRSFRPGPDFFRMASLVVGKLSMTSLAKPFLSAAVAQGNESAYLCVFDPKVSKLVFAACAESTHLLDYRVPLNTPSSVAVGGSGLAILAWLDEARIDAIAADELRNGVIASEAKLKKALKDVRAAGFALTFGQRIKGAVGLFVPVFNAAGEVCGSFGFTIPEVRYQPVQKSLLVTVAMRNAQGLSRALGHNPGGAR
ncbi:MAG: transcriptional regulator, IclR family [Ramlibacter sp.]|nr:transcriptional regulator, IclR family [Ramlibacter sp.]